jgi:hypothetical protein
MTSQEQQMLQGLTTRVNQTVLQDKDPEAEQFIGQSLGRNPDALYILAQTVLVQQYALDQAKKQLDELRQQAQNQPAQPQKHTSFLGNLLGMNDPAPPPPPSPQQAQYGQPQYAPVANYGPGSGQPQYGQPQYGQPQYGQPQVAGQGSFLRSAMQTATGVAAGALAFQGIESLMHGFGGHSGSGFGDFGGGGGRDEVVNNYYGDSGAAGRGVSRDIEDRRNDAGSDTSLADNDPDDFADTSSDTGVDTSLADNDSDNFGSSDDSNS